MNKIKEKVLKEVDVESCKETLQGSMLYDDTEKLDIKSYNPEVDYDEVETIINEAISLTLAEVQKQVKDCEIKKFNHSGGISFPSDLISKEELLNKIGEKND